MVIDESDLWQTMYLSQSPNSTQAIENDDSGRPIYIGYAQAGSSKADARWQIRKCTYDGNGYLTDIQFANGTALFDKVWDKRKDGTYTYS